MLEIEEMMTKPLSDLNVTVNAILAPARLRGRLQGTCTSVQFY